jgi:hypothetical protein
MGPSCCSVARVEATYLVLLIAAFLTITAAAGFVVIKLIGPR